MPRHRRGPLFPLPPPRVRMGIRRKPVADRYRIGTNPIDTDSIALVVKNGADRPDATAPPSPGTTCGAGTISSRAPQGVHIAVSSSSPALKSLEESVELDELQPHHPLKDVL